MIVEWDVHYTIDYPEDDIRDIIKVIEQEGWDDTKVASYIYDTISGFDDEYYYAWDHDQTMKVVDEIKHRIGGIQLSMFDKDGEIK